MTQENLVIVESPAKAKTIERFLGKDYKVMSSYGHIRDLKKKEISIDMDTLLPYYEIPEELVDKAFTYLPDDMLDIVTQFYDAIVKDIEG